MDPHGVTMMYITTQNKLLCVLVYVCTSRDAFSYNLLASSITLTRL